MPIPLPKGILDLLQMGRELLERIRGNTVLHTACLFRGNFRIHLGVKENPLEEAVFR